MAITAAALIISASCSWASPGADRFTGDPVDAVDHYRDIPAEVRERLKTRIARKQFDEIAVITRDRIGDDYGARIYDMHFGANKLCKEVTRTAWKPGAVERGLVFCEGTYCLILPTVCGNLSRISRMPKMPTLELPPPAAPPLVELPQEDRPGTPKTRKLPEPSSWALFGLAAFAAFVARRRG